MSSPVPQWLDRSLNDRTHFVQVLAVLSDRERARSMARAATRGPPFDLKHRLASSAPVLAQPRSYLTEHYSVSVANKPENVWLNRYMDIEPYDRTRVQTNKRYFNGNWVRELYGGAWWIATQAPLPLTTYEFLSIVAGIEPLRPPGDSRRPAPHARVRTVVQLTNHIENGCRKTDPYLPARVGESVTIAPPENRPDLPTLNIKLTACETVASARCTSSTVVVSTSSQAPPVVFRHLLYHAWPDHGVPEREDRIGLLHFIKLVDRVNRESPGGVGNHGEEGAPPIMVHCSAGVGRTGSFIALTSLLRANGLLSASHAQLLTGAPLPSSKPPAPLPASALGPLPNEVAWDLVAQEIDSLREQRPGMVQRPEQALLVYDVLHTAIASREFKSTNGI